MNFHHHEDGRLIECRHCMSPKLIKYGVTSGIAQRYKCLDCKKTFSLDGKHRKYKASEKNIILCRANEHGLKKIAKAFHISPNTIRKWRVALVKEDIATHSFTNYNALPPEPAPYNQYFSY